MPTATPTTLIGRRYLLQEQLGQGAMGIVYHALDRLTGQAIALKQVTTATENLHLATSVPGSSSINVRLSLAREFQTLATIRHPHIIDVLDYGFDIERQPYFTMELVEGSKTIIQIGQQQKLETKITLLGQLLQALAYLHRRGILHRDVKPSNVLVLNGQVKVLDFGLSITQQQSTEPSETTAGTLAYMAPELLRGDAATESSDLYAVGVIAFELLAGYHPFTSDKLAMLTTSRLTTRPTLPNTINPKLAAVVERLLAVAPADRFGDANQVIDALSEATGQTIVGETAAIRESFLQAARLIEREAELGQLSQVLQEANKAQVGSAWLIGGESGVGKSRLMNEIRTLALVQGTLVLRGQAISEGGAIYQVWRDALRWLCLLSDLNDLDASVLKALVPDINTLLGRVVPDAPELDPKATQERLVSVIEALFRRQQQPITLILEDLHWAGSENLVVLKQLNKIVQELPLLIIASYRDDERPELSNELGMNLLKLKRLSRKGIADLSASMIGPAGRQPQLVQLLERETEGNVFFMVEVVRALAEASGELDQIGDRQLPEKVISGGIQLIIQRRLNRVPQGYHPMLAIAAVAGRQLDLNLLRAIEPSIDIFRWLTACASAAVIEVQDERWRFAHDKLRDGLLAELSAETRREVHDRVARAIESLHPDLSVQAGVLAYHWGMAGEPEKETEYAIQAGDVAVRSYAFKEARGFYKQALDVLPRLPDTIENRRRRIDTINNWVRVSYSAEDPKNYLPRLQEAETLARELPAPDGTPGGDRLRLARVHYWIGISHYYRGAAREGITYFRQVVAVAQELGDEQLLTIPAAVIGRALSAQGRFDQALPLLNQAVGPLEKLGDWANWIITFSWLGYDMAYSGQYAAGLANIQRVLAYATEKNYLSGIAMAYVYLTNVYMMGGETLKAQQAGQMAVQASEQSGDKIYRYLAFAYHGWVESRLGNHNIAAEQTAQSDAIAQGSTLIMADLLLATKAEIALNANRVEEAVTLGEKCVALAQSVGGVLAEGLAQRVWGQALARLEPPQWDQAETHLAASVTTLESCHAYIDAARTQFFWGQICAASRRSTAAREHLQKAAAQFETSGLTHELEKVQVALKKLE